MEGHNPTEDQFYYCRKCERERQACDIKIQQIGRTTVYICRFCRGPAEPMADESVQEDEATVAASTDNPLLQLPYLLQYPFRGDGTWLILSGSICFALISMVMPLISLFLFIYFLSCALNVLRTSALGHDEPPAWMDFTRFGEIIFNCLLLVGAALVCYGPFMFFLVNGGLPHGALYLLLLGLGHFMFPMYLLSVTINESFASLNPVNVVLSIVNTAGSYAKLAGGLLIVWIVYMLVAASPLLMIPIVGPCIQWFVMIYFMFIFLRLLGIFYRVQQERLVGFD